MLFLLLSAEVKVIKLSLVLIKLVPLSSNSMQLDYESSKNFINLIIITI